MSLIKQNQVDQRHETSDGASDTVEHVLMNEQQQILTLNTNF